MKLYTEEEVKRAMLHSYLSGVERPSDYLPIEESILRQVTPIELPSDVEIEEEIMKWDWINQYYERGFSNGVKWMKEQILNQNK